MAQVNFEWQVESVDDTLGTMVVQYKVDGIDEAVSLNIPRPLASFTTDEIHSHIAKFLPQQLMKQVLPEYADLAPGSTGRSAVSFAEETPDVPNLVGSWNEEYIRAMVYLVLEEIRESEA